MTVRNPLLQGRERGVWHPDLVGKVPQYPRSEEAFLARQASGRAQAAKLNARGWTPSRQGIPDGWAGRRPEVIAIRAQAATDAEKIIKHMTDNDLLIPIPEDDEGRVKAGLRYLAETMLDRTHPIRERTSACKTLLDFCKAKPAQKSEVSLTSPEAFLALLAQKDTTPE